MVCDTFFWLLVFGGMFAMTNPWFLVFWLATGTLLAFRWSMGFLLFAGVSVVAEVAWLLALQLGSRPSSYAATGLPGPWTTSPIAHRTRSKYKVDIRHGVAMWRSRHIE
jgi:hypothetical protein